ncbi:cytidylyltransferase [Helicobacter sp. MIT 00-7814]|uniref:acylneuraminate cytidylyltransferase family protein n=1 Tax=unclassified Helicobacter TaxID=2593540 RepID=UPI000E1E715E|nr:MULTISPECIES: acylneuraminate cytidylyltransferase family protein [unclassified Helicobacter]RDU57131.1 cytidylyltransferase [Helicobacter sp. MIT 00-7814]RDU57683.1 cytidylyltransferase [Helicobacter sp. MIT 99-10781]
MKFTAVIPVRSGSQRVKNKNLRSFANSSLLEVKILQMKRIKSLGFIDEIVVNSNSDEMLEIAVKLGVNVVKRDEYFATSEVSINEVVVNLAQNINSDTMILSNATSPMITDSTIITCLKTYKKNIGSYDSLATAHLCKEFLYLNQKPLNYDPKHKPRSQDLPDILVLNSALYIISRDLTIRKCDVVGYKPYFEIIPLVESIDIDNELDFEIAEFLYKKYHIGTRQLALCKKRGGVNRCFLNLKNSPSLAFTYHLGLYTPAIPHSLLGVA